MTAEPCRLFEVKPRAAQKLIQIISVGAKVGRSALVERVALADFLTVVAESDDQEATLRVPGGSRTLPLGGR